MIYGAMSPLRAVELLGGAAVVGYTVWLWTMHFYRRTTATCSTEIRCDFLLEKGWFNDFKVDTSDDHLSFYRRNMVAHLAFLAAFLAISAAARLLSGPAPRDEDGHPAGHALRTVARRCTANAALAVAFIAFVCGRDATWPLLFALVFYLAFALLRASGAPIAVLRVTVWALGLAILVGSITFTDVWDWGTILGESPRPAPAYGFLRRERRPFDNLLPWTRLDRKSVV